MISDFVLNKHENWLCWSSNFMNQICYHQQNLYFYWKYQCPAQTMLTYCDTSEHTLWLRQKLPPLTVTFCANADIEQKITEQFFDNIQKLCYDSGWNKNMCYIVTDEDCAIRAVSLWQIYRHTFERVVDRSNITHIVPQVIWSLCPKDKEYRKERNEHNWQQLNRFGFWKNDSLIDSDFEMDENSTDPYLDIQQWYRNYCLIQNKIKYWNDF